MTKFKNSLKKSFLDSIQECSIEAEGNDHAARCKFNFSYFEVQSAGQAFGDWDHPQLVSLLEKLKEFCKKPLDYWTNQHAGKSGRVLSIYGAFPAKSDFTPPKHVPHEAKWGRFRLAHKVRLVGFVVPEATDGKVQKSSGRLLCCNTFYVVFLDAEHCFYKSEDA